MFALLWIDSFIFTVPTYFYWILIISFSYFLLACCFILSLNTSGRDLLLFSLYSIQTEVFFIYLFLLGALLATFHTFLYIVFIFSLHFLAIIFWILSWPRHFQKHLQKKFLCIWHILIPFSLLGSIFNILYPKM